MKKILGLDLGSSSIGWAYIIESSDENSKNLLVDAGVRIIPLDSKEKDEFVKGGNVPTNQARRMARQMRRNLHRYKLRRRYLHEFLQANGLMPDETLLRKLPPKDLYALREMALVEKLTPGELGRVFIHLNLRRGYKSSRKDSETDSDGKKQSDYLQEIKERESILQDKHVTIGQYLSVALKNNPHYRVRQQIFNRQTYQQEFDLIWEHQQQYYPEILTSANYKILKDKVLYFQRPLKSQKGLVGECALEWGFALDKQQQKIYLPNGQEKIVRPKCAPKSSPLAQEVRIWENIHNIRIWDEKNNEHKLSLPDKQKIFDCLQDKKDLTSNGLLKLLGLSPEIYTTDAAVREKGLKGNTTRVRFLDVFKKVNIQRRDILTFDPRTEEAKAVDLTTGAEFNRLQIAADFDQEPLYQLWHLVYATEQEKDLVVHLQNRYGFTQDQANAVAKITFNNDGFSNKSSRAMRRLLPHLRNGSDYASSCSRAGYNHSNSITKEENAARQLLQALPILPKNSLRNPVVEKILNQMIHLVNDILNDPQLGRPDEIRVELARELKQSAKERDRAYSRNNKRERENKDIRQQIAEILGTSPESVTRIMIEKWRLYHEVGKVSLYTGKPIELKKLLLGEGVDIEHIIPKSRCFDDSFENKTICETNFNQIKDKMTAMDFMESQAVAGLQSFDAYLRRVNDLAKSGKTGGKEGEGISNAKFKKLLMKASEIPDDFIERQLRETQYIAKKSIDLLKDICLNVLSTSGSVTDFLRHQWGWDEVIGDLRFPHFKEHGLTEKITVKKGGVREIERIKNWTKRLDHRHHALDALVVACTKPGVINQLNKLNQIFEGLKGDNRREALHGQKQIVPQAPFTTADVAQVMENILISFKQGQKVATPGKKSHNSTVKKPTPRGPLHEETIYGRIRQYKTVHLNSRFNPDCLGDAVHPHQRELVEQRLALFSGNVKKALGDLENNPILYGKNAEKSLKKITVWDYYFLSRKEVGPLLTDKQVEKIQGPEVKKLVKQRLDEGKGDPKTAFKNLGENPIVLNGKPVNRVRVRNNAEALIQLPRGFVESGSNHHIAIYKDPDGKKHEHVVQFWQAFQRIRLGLPIIIKNPAAVYDQIAQAPEGTYPDDLHLPEGYNWEFVTSLKINDMFVFDVDPNEVDFLDPKNRKRLSKGLFKVRKLTAGSYWFLHHLETQILEDTLSKSMQRAKQCSISSLKGVKVQIDRLGRIISVGENM